MVTLKMIAQHCGVSTATVSKALNGAADINRDTALRVRQTASKLGYLPNAAARTLKTNRSLNFGVVIRDDSHFGLTHEFQANVMEGFTQRAEELGYDVSFLTGRLGGKRMSFTEHARYRGCDGVLIMITTTSPELWELIDSGIPVVLIDHQREGCGSVCSDNAKGTADLVRHVYERGCRRIAFIHGEDMALTRRRIEGFYAACRELGLEVPPEYVRGAIYRDAATNAAATRSLMALPQPPDCILYPDDMAFVGGRDALEAMGLSIPGDVAAVGYDGTNLSQMLQPKLTTVYQDTKRMGACAAEELVRMATGGAGYRPQEFLIPGTLLPGGTVGERKPV